MPNKKNEEKIKVTKKSQTHFKCAKGFLFISFYCFAWEENYDLIWWTLVTFQKME
mgnify:CR=1 FL=1